MSDLLCDVSVVVPVFNEAKTLLPLYERCCAVLDQTGLSWELIWVDDGSEDESVKIAQKVMEKDQRVHLVTQGHRGQAVATASGIALAHGEMIVTLDADLEVHPRVLPGLFEKILEGADLVLGARVRTSSPLFSKIMFKHLTRSCIRWLLNKRLKQRLSDPTTSLRVFRRELALKALVFSQTQAIHIHLALLFLASRIVEVAVPYQERRESRYHFIHLIRLGLWILASMIRVGNRERKSIP